MNPINTILLQPTDVLFFRDGRPMEGSLAGHGAAWPLPNVTNAAFHAALHRSNLNGHRHDQRHHAEHAGTNNRQFGSLVTAGPFPVHRNSGTDTWHCPRPLDLLDGTVNPALLPTNRSGSIQSSLPAPLRFAVANRLPPSKDTAAKAWLSAAAYRDYLDGNTRQLNQAEACDDSAFGDAEATIGIAIDAETGTTGQGEAAGRIYSARYLRLRDDWRLGVFAKTDEKTESSESRDDLIGSLLTRPSQILVGGQQRICTATRCELKILPLPHGRSEGFEASGGKYWIKWILLSPAIWPEIPAESKDGRPMTPHTGGWLPNWIRADDGRVLLRSGERMRRSYSGKHTRGFGAESKVIAARLVAAIVPKPIVVTGWALGGSGAKSEIKNQKSELPAGAKSTHLAVPAGAVYYFEADSEDDARNLAAALNWHGSETNPITIKNRRSTLMGEKGFGLGVCGTWRFYGDQ
jgi:CRISPR-associated protein Cmr3